ncbi:microtubule-associated tumor suppressor 1 homolog A isoform X2 [Astyanax mexicanus]|uniref:microtubule-associated tumor suppressor 1 homolog A isoform X2 n=1 Tax=Astyanax mexicanus TaxID=7994 RepID=UPI0020CAA4DB|nr:microtubule-associated tumor suppressor 1 homolog A isoform X2 [Astyanax mexicanus]
MEVPNRVMHLTFSVEDRNGNDITCPVSDPSPDSLRTNSSLSHGSTDSPDDMEMVEDCSSEENLVRKVILQSENTAMMDFVKTDDNCNQQNDSNSKSSQTPIFCKPSKTRGSRSCLDSAEQEVFVLNSVKISRCNSETCSSVSSGEMVLRNNSFIIHESEPQLSVSLLDESSDIPSDVGMMPGSLPDVCEGLVNNMVSKHQELGVTFIQPSNQTFIMEEEVFQLTPGSLVLHGSERKSSHLIPGVDRADCVTPINWNKSNTEAKKFLSHTSGSLHSTPAEGRTFHLPNSEELDFSGNAQTSTPVQALSSKTFCVPTLSDSSPNKGGKSDSGSPLEHVIKEKPVSSVLKKPRTPMTAPPKMYKPENKRFAKPDFSNVKSKVVTRPSSASKLASVSAVRVSSNISHQFNRNHQTTKTPHSMQHKTSLTKPTAVVSSNPTNTSASNGIKKLHSTVGKRVRAATCQEEAPAPKSRPRTRSETSNSSKITKEESGDVKEVSTNLLNTTTCSSVDIEQNKTTSLTNQADKSSASSGEVKKVDASVSISRKPPRTTPKTPSSRLAEPAPCDWSKGRLGSQPSSSRAGGVPAARGPAANPRQPPLPGSKLKPGTAGKNGCATTDMPSPRIKPSTSGGNQKMRLTECTGAEASVHPKHSVTPAHPHNAASKLPVKPRGQLKSASASNGHSKPDYVEASSGVFGKPPTNRAASVRTRLQSLPPRASSAGCRNTSLTSQASVRSSPNVLKTSAPPRHVRLAGASSVDKGKAKTTVRNHQQQQGQTNGHPDLVPPETKPRGVEYFKALCEKKNQTIQHLKNSLAVNNRKFEAITVVVQNLSAKHEEAVKRRQEISRELLSLREELVSSAQSCERLEQEKEDLRVTFDGVLQKVQEQHRSDLSDLEERLKTFYSAEWVKVHQTYQDEADKCKAQMEQQLEELRARHEDLKQELEVSHGQKVESLKQHYEETFEELRNSHELDMNTLKKKLNDAETTLSNQIEELTAENCSLSERLKVEEDRRKELADKCQDSHTLYLEQELESLKVVLDIKNKQIHQQDKKLMQMDKLLEKNVKIDECLKKVQQENEDLKARMDRHAALSRQLSTEQAVLQESLQKESKVNKRLSMENEELLWKLQNGDLSSPRKTSPSSPSITLQSPHNSGLFSSPPISPR